MKGLIFSIKKYCIHDGPGIRVTVFMKGCPLSCCWCHNPEGILPGQETVINIFRIGEREFGRSEEVATCYSVENIIDILERERIFIQHSGGGVTFSGGEPLMQPEFLAAALRACNLAGYHTAVDTSGYAPAGNLRLILPFTDLFLFDIKHLDDKKHIEATGVSNSLILENYRLLLEQAAGIVLRIPVIPGFNDDNVHIEDLLRYISDTRTASLKMISLLPYHRTGESKYRRLNRSWLMEGVEPPGARFMNELKDRFLATGVKVRIGG